MCPLPIGVRLSMEIELGETASGILNNFFFNVIITLRSLDSYTTWCFHKYGCPKITLQNSRGETSHNTSSLKGLMSDDKQHYWLAWMSLPLWIHLMV
jgi:hypothetical protein